MKAKSPLSLAVGKVRQFLRFVRLRLGMYSGNRADVIDTDTFGKVLTALAQCRRFVNYVEIGTAHGLGTTKLIADALFARPDSCCLWTVESYDLAYSVAIRNWRNTNLRGKLIFIHGAVAADAVMTWDEIQAEPEYKPETHDHFRNMYEKNKNIAKAPAAMPHLPQDIDVLLLDGGDFYSYGEYRALADRAKVICLDDSCIIKNRRVRAEMLDSDKWVLAADNSQERYGWSVFCRPELLETIASLCELQ